jgi:hypothetical protein
MGLDLGRRRALGVCAVPLWSLGARRRSVVLGPWHFRTLAGARAGACRFSRWAGRRAIRFRGRRAAGRVVSAGSRRGLLAELRRRSELCPRAQPRQCRKHRPHRASARRMAPAQVPNPQFANRRFAAVVPQHVFASAAKVNPAVLHVPAAALEHAPVTMRSPQMRPVQAQSMRGPAGLPARSIVRAGCCRLGGLRQHCRSSTRCSPKRARSTGCRRSRRDTAATFVDAT